MTLLEFVIRIGVVIMPGPVIGLER